MTFLIWALLCAFCSAPSKPKSLSLFEDFAQWPQNVLILVRKVRDFAPRQRAEFGKLRSNYAVLVRSYTFECRYLLQCGELPSNPTAVKRRGNRFYQLNGNVTAWSLVQFAMGKVQGSEIVKRELSLSGFGNFLLDEFQSEHVWMAAKFTAAFFFPLYIIGHVWIRYRKYQP